MGVDLAAGWPEDKKTVQEIYPNLEFKSSVIKLNVPGTLVWRGKDAHIYLGGEKMLVTNRGMKTQRWLFFTAQLETFPVVVPVKTELMCDWNHWCCWIPVRTSENTTPESIPSPPQPPSPEQQAQAEKQRFLHHIRTQACANTSSWRWCNSKARPKGNGSLQLPLNLHPTSRLLYNYKE